VNALRISRALPALLIAALIARPAAGADPVRISARKKTISRRRSSVQDLPRGPSRSVTTQVAYDFRILALTPAAAGPVQVEWVTLVETPRGAVQARGYGRTNLILQLGREVSVSSTPVTVTGREWIGGPNPGVVEEKIAGYAVRVVDPAGKVLAEKCQPSSLRGFVDWEKAARPPAPRARRLMRRLAPLLRQPPPE